MNIARPAYEVLNRRRAGAVDRLGRGRTAQQRPQATAGRDEHHRYEALRLAEHREALRRMEAFTRLLGLFAARAR